MGGHDGESGKVNNQVLLVVAMFSFSTFAIAEMVAASVAHSESLLGDAATMIVDGLSYGLNLWAEKAKLGKSRRHQLIIDIIVPLISTAFLVAITIYVLIDAIDRVKNPDESGAQVNVTIMWAFATVNLVLDFGNIAMFFMEKDEDGKWHLNCKCCCSKADGEESESSNLNMLSALAHVAADTLRSIAVMVAGIYAEISAADDSEQADAIGAIVVSVAIAGSVVPICWEVMRKIGELYNVSAYAAGAMGSTSYKLLEHEDVFNSDIDDDEEEIVPWRPDSPETSA